VHQIRLVSDAAELAGARGAAAEDGACGVGAVPVRVGRIVRAAARDQGADAALEIGVHRGQNAGVEPGVGVADHLPLAGKAPSVPGRDRVEVCGGRGLVVAALDFGPLLDPLHLAARGEVGDRAERQDGLHDAPARAGAGRLDLAAQPLHDGGERRGVLRGQGLD